MSFLDFFDNNNLVPRQQQIQILKNELDKSWNDYDYFFIDAPVGVGKTYVALAIADKIKNSYFLTSTKQLQEQYEQHSAGIVSLMGRSNYKCNIDPDFNVDAAPCTADANLKRRCMSQKFCDYYNQKDKALASRMMITNYPYFLYSVHCGPLSKDDSETPWVQREAIIMDEAHELESCLISIAETKLIFEELYEQYGIGSDELKITENKEFNYNIVLKIVNQLKTKTAKLKQEITDLFSSGKSTKSVRKISDLNSKLYKLDKILQPLIMFIRTRNDDEWLETPNFDENSLTISPLSAKTLFNHFLGEVAKKYVFTSATLGDPNVFAKELGIDRSRMKVIRVGTPFLPEKSPITILPICKMNYKELDKNLSTIVDAVAAIMDHHKDEKGIIHSGNYKIAKAIYDKIDTEHKNRLLLRDMFEGMSLHNSNLVSMHNEDADPTVLLSPSMTTGIDLYGDLSRFQIIVKLPFLSLSDPRVKKKSQLDSNWYRSKMWIQVLQSTGRSIRSEDDFAETYILDASFDYFYKMDYNTLAGWFRDRIDAAL